MRSSKSRSRSKANRNRSMGNIINRVFDSSGPEGKVRGTPQQIIDKYNQLARDAQLGNDRVAAENFQQHAEHYLRLLSEAQREMDARREQAERENRERQLEREKERAERQEQQPPSEPEHDTKEGEGGFDVVTADSDDTAQLVETPENNSGKKSPRKPRGGAAAAAKSADTPEAASVPEATPPSVNGAAIAEEGGEAEAPKPKPRRRRAPRKTEAAAKPETSEPTGDPAAPSASE